MRRYESLTLSASLTRASLLVAALLLSLLARARFPAKERPFTHSLPLLDAPSARLAAAAPGGPRMPAAID